MNYNKSVVGERIKIARQKPFNGTSSYSQSNLAVALGLDSTSRTTIRKWERGEVFPPLDHLLKMCELFGCELGYLLGEYDLPTRDETDFQKITGLSDDAVQAICRCGEIKLKDGYYDISHGLAKMILNRFLKSQAFQDMMKKLCSCYVAFHTVADLESERTAKDMIEMQNCATEMGMIVLYKDQAAEFFASAAADNLKHFAMTHIADLDVSQENHGDSSS